jgi:hypothetical protein
MFKKLQISAWNEVGGSRLDYTSASLETLGELRELKKEKYKNNQHETPVDVDKLRKMGM